MYGERPRAAHALRIDSKARSSAPVASPVAPTTGTNSSSSTSSIGKHYSGGTNRDVSPVPTHSDTTPVRSRRLSQQLEDENTPTPVGVADSSVMSWTTPHRQVSSHASRSPSPMLFIEDTGEGESAPKPSDTVQRVKISRSHSPEAQYEGAAILYGYVDGQQRGSGSGAEQMQRNSLLPIDHSAFQLHGSGAKVVRKEAPGLPELRPLRLETPDVDREGRINLQLPPVSRGNGTARRQPPHTTSKYPGGMRSSRRNSTSVPYSGRRSVGGASPGTGGRGERERERKTWAVPASQRVSRGEQSGLLDSALRHSTIARRAVAKGEKRLSRFSRFQNRQMEDVQRSLSTEPNAEELAMHRMRRSPFMRSDAEGEDAEFKEILGDVGDMLQQLSRYYPDQISSNIKDRLLPPTNTLHTATTHSGKAEVGNGAVESGNAKAMTSPGVRESIGGGHNRRPQTSLSTSAPNGTLSEAIREALFSGQQSNNSPQRKQKAHGSPVRKRASEGKRAHSGLTDGEDDDLSPRGMRLSLQSGLVPDSRRWIEREEIRQAQERMRNLLQGGIDRVEYFNQQYGNRVDTVQKIIRAKIEFIRNTPGESHSFDTYTNEIRRSRVQHSLQLRRSGKDFVRENQTQLQRLKSPELMHRDWEERHATHMKHVEKVQFRKELLDEIDHARKMTIWNSDMDRVQKIRKRKENPNIEIDEKHSEMLWEHVVVQTSFLRWFMTQRKNINDMRSEFHDRISAASTIQRWFRHSVKKRLDATVSRARRTIRNNLWVFRLKLQARRKHRSVDMIKDVLSRERDAVHFYQKIVLFKNKIVCVQRAWRRFFACMAAQYELNSKQWDHVDGHRVHREEKRRVQQLKKFRMNMNSMGAKNLVDRKQALQREFDKLDQGRPSLIPEDVKKEVLTDGLRERRRAFARSLLAYSHYQERKHMADVEQMKLDMVRRRLSVNPTSPLHIHNSSQKSLLSTTDDGEDEELDESEHEKRLAAYRRVRSGRISVSEAATSKVSLVVSNVGDDDNHSDHTDDSTANAAGKERDDRPWFRALFSKDEMLKLIHRAIALMEAREREAVQKSLAEMDKRSHSRGKLKSKRGGSKSTVNSSSASLKKSRKRGVSFAAN